MKKFYLISALAVALASCSSDLETQSGQNDSSKGKGEENYIAVNIVAANAATRADAVASSSNYEDGEGDENAVNVVRLYFFDASGNPFVVYEDDEDNSYSYVNVTEDFLDQGKDSPNVEKILTATAAVTLPKGEFPSQLIAVINPDNNLSDLTMASLEDVEGATNINNVTGTFATSKPSSFVMSNSVYSDGAQTNPQKMETVSISASNFFNVAAAAQANPVTIYVERVVGKISVTSSLTPVTSNVTTTETLYATGATYNGNPVYVKFLGWNVTATANESYLMKNINPGWPETLFGQNSGQPWNYAGFYRSFWAVNPSGLTYNYYNFGIQENEDGTFETIDDEYAANAITGFAVPVENGPANYTYIQENAADDYSTGAGSNHPSQVIVAAQLCDGNGRPLTIAQWGSGQYPVETLKNLYLAAIRTNLNPWKKVTTTGQTTYSQISADDIEFVTAGSLDNNLNNWQVTGRYYVYAQLTEEAAKAVWVNNNNAEAEDLTFGQINSGLKALGRAKIWNNGYTYYYFDIRHLGGVENGPGYYGIVRNHLYKCNIEALEGLGTPVFDPEETIYPEKPEDEDTYIAAQINILSWRIVSQNVSFAW